MCFAESNNFVLYDFWNEHGTVDENVFAYSNVSGGRALACDLQQRLREHARDDPCVGGLDGQGIGNMRQRSLHEALHLAGDDGGIVAYKDTTIGLEYLRRIGELRNDGFRVDLRGYQYVVLQEWREVQVSVQQPWDQLCDALHGAGVYNLAEAISKLRLRGVHEALRHLLSGEVIASLVESAGVVPRASEQETVTKSQKVSKKTKGAPVQVSVDQSVGKAVELAEALFREVEELAVRAADGTGKAVDEGSAGASRTVVLRTGIAAALRLPGLQSASPVWPASASAIVQGGASGELGRSTWATILAWTVLRHLKLDAQSSVRLFDELQLRSALAEIFSGMGVMGEDAWRAAARVRVMLAHGTAMNDVLPGSSSASGTMAMYVGWPALMSRKGWCTSTRRRSMSCSGG